MPTAAAATDAITITIRYEVIDRIVQVLTVQGRQAEGTSLLAAAEAAAPEQLPYFIQQGWAMLGR